MSTSRADLILRQLDALTPLSTSALRVIQAAGQPEPDRDKLAALLQRNPTLSRCVERLLTGTDLTASASVAGRLQSRIRRGARFPSRVVHAMIAAAAARALRPGHAVSTESRAARLELWRHSVAVACAAELLAGRTFRKRHRRGPRIDPMQAFCAGLLHDIGKLALQAALPRSYGRVMRTADALRGDIAEVERQLIGLDHHAAGRHVAQRWRLPDALRQSTWLHNQRPAVFNLVTGSAQHAPLIMLVSLADSLARGARIGYSGNHTYGLSHELLARPLGLRAHDIDFVMEHLVARTSTRAAALGVSCAADDIYRASLHRVSSDLLRIRRQMETQTQLQAARAHSFRAMGSLAAELNPDAGVEEVLASIAHCMAGAIDSGPILVFIHESSGAAEVVLRDAQQIEHRRLFAARRSRTGQSQELITQAAGDLEWLTSQYSPRLEGSHRWCMALASEGEVIGGIVWGGGASEPSRLSPRADVLEALRAGCALALRIAQVRAEAARTAQELQDTNRRLAMAQDQIAQDRAVLCVAELAAGAAHEMNNPLMVISGRSQLLYHKLTDERDRQAALAIHQNAQRLSDMITSLMRYARPSAAELQPISVHDLFAQAMLLIAEIPERHGRKIEWIARDLPPLQADNVQLARALAALLENALQATESGTGHIEVSAALDVTGENLVITIFDNGTGMDAATLERAFDPFFSAKPAGRRRGMGLAVALRLIEANGGALRLDSRLGAGTRAVVTLPVRSTQAQAEPPRARKSA